MSYEKYTWQSGEVITAEKLNHMEAGISDILLPLTMVSRIEGRVYLYDGEWIVIASGGLYLIDETIPDTLNGFPVMQYDNTTRLLTAYAIEHSDGGSVGGSPDLGVYIIGDTNVLTVLNERGEIEAVFIHNDPALYEVVQA